MASDAKIKLKRGNRATLIATTTVFDDGQPIYERDTGRLKIGNGSDKYSNLPYVDSSEMVVERSNQDDNGIYTTVKYKWRSSGRTFCQSVLTGDSPVYSTRTETFYNRAGTAVYTESHTITYGEDQYFLSET